MSKVENKERLNYNKFDEMSSDDLRAILQADFDAPEAECMDVDTIIYISSLLAERKKADLQMQTLNVSVAKAEFYKEYYPLKDNEGLIQDILGNVEEEDKYSTKHKKNVLVHNNLYKRVASMVAAVLIVFCVGSVTAYALGYNPLSAIARWNDEHFWLEKQVDTNDVTNILANYGDIVNLVPKWLPRGYKFEDVKTVQYPDGQIIRSSFVKDGDKRIFINYRQGVANMDKNYEKTNDEIIKYDKGGIEHYIIENIDNIAVIWVNNDFECSIIAQISVDEAKKIIDSLYGGLE